MNQTTIDGGEDDRAAATPPGPSPVNFRIDPEARAIHAVVAIAVGFVALALSGLAALWLGGEHAGLAGWTLVASAVVYAVLTAVACLVPRPLDGDGLSLDLAGLTVTRAGVDRRWPWRNLGNFSLSARPYLAGWFLGRRISIGVPASPPSTPAADGARRESTILHIAGDYLAPDHEIAGALSAFRDHRAGYPMPDESGVRVPGGTFHLRDQHARTAKTRNAAISGIFSWVIVYAAAAAVGGLYDGWQAFLDHWTDPLSHPLILTVATLFVPYDIWSGVRKFTPAGNHLQVDADGVGLAIEGRRRRWRWDSVSAPEIQEASETEGATRRCIVFIARHDGFSSSPQTTPGLLPAALRFIVEDIYDAPLETIVGQMAEFRAGFRSDPVPTAATAPGAVPLPT